MYLLLTTVLYSTISVVNCITVSVTKTWVDFG